MYLTCRNSLRKVFHLFLYLCSKQTDKPKEEEEGGGSQSDSRNRSITRPREAAFEIFASGKTFFFILSLLAHIASILRREDV